MLTLFPQTAQFTTQGQIILAGHDLASLADQYGTPLYLYDAATIRQQVERLLALLKDRYPGPSEITYAAKAYFSLGFARRLAELGVGVDVVSRGELSVAHQAGFQPGKVHLHGNNKSPAELRAALDWGLQAIVVDNLDELALLEELAAQSRRQARVWLRLTPGVDVHTHKAVQTGHHASKFGLPIATGQAEEAIRRALQSRWLTLTGLHTHLGSQIFEPEPYRAAVRALASLAHRMGWTPEELSPGGGWGVPYVDPHQENDPAPWIETVSQSLQEEAQKYGWPLPKLVVEPGRWLAARAGVTVYSVGVVKTAGDGTRLVAVDGGMADNPRPALYSSPYTARAILRGAGRDPESLSPAAVVGKFCESGDQLIQQVLLPDEIRRGDLLVMPVTGAYQLSMASNYNLAERPAALWLEEGRVEVLQSREDPSQSGWWTSCGPA